jgi:hypothetical protein
MTDIAEGADVASAFAELMGKAAEVADSVVDPAPFGYKADGTPKKAAGRPRRSPSVDELKAAVDGVRDAADADFGVPAPVEPEVQPDRAPDEAARPARKDKKPVSRETIPPYRGGVIASGVNRLYRRAGKIVRAMDHDIGTAIIESARNTADPGEPDDSVGAAWDELAKTNPRVRKFLLKCLAGGAWGQLVMAHAPIVMAIVMKPAILKFIPFSALVSSMAEPDEDTKPGEGALPGGMTAPDVNAMADLAMAQVRKMGLPVNAETEAAMQAFAAGMGNGQPADDSVKAAAQAAAYAESFKPFAGPQQRHQPRRGPARAKR